MDKDHIVAEIRRTAILNGGKPLGRERFEVEAGIGFYEWYPHHWMRWGDALVEAGFEPNRMTVAFEDEFLLEKLVEITRRLQRVPIEGDLILASKNDATFPNRNVFRKLGKKAQRIERVIAFCESQSGHEDVVTLWKQIVIEKRTDDVEEIRVENSIAGYVYLLKHGSRREYKIGRTNNPIRREGEIGIQLPEKLTPIHQIKTDDPAGVESYWHKRFASKRKQGEWFALTTDDVRAFKRWKRIY